VRLGVEDAGDLSGQGVLKIHGAQAEQFVDGASNGAHAGVLVGDRAGLDPGAGHQQQAAVRIHVVHAALGIVFGHKNR
jgi:hypothetical protein